MTISGEVSLTQACIKMKFLFRCIYSKSCTTKTFFIVKYFNDSWLCTLWRRITKQTRNHVAFASVYLNGTRYATFNYHTIP